MCSGGRETLETILLFMTHVKNDGNPLYTGLELRPLLVEFLI